MHSKCTGIEPKGKQVNIPVPKRGDESGNATELELVGKMPREELSFLFNDETTVESHYAEIRLSKSEEHFNLWSVWCASNDP